MYSWFQGKFRVLFYWDIAWSLCSRHCSPDFTLFRANRSPEHCNTSKGGCVYQMINQRFFAGMRRFFADIVLLTSKQWLSCAGRSTCHVCSPPLFSLVCTFLHSHMLTQRLTILLTKSLQLEMRTQAAPYFFLGDFNHTELTTLLSKYMHRVTCPTR